MACIPFPRGQSQRRVQKADLLKFLPNLRTKISESPIRRECSHSRLCRYRSDVTTKNSAPSTSTSMLHLDTQSSPCQGFSLKRRTTEAMSMKSLRLRQSVQYWVLFLRIKSVYDHYNKKTKEMNEASASVDLLLATALLVWYVYVADSLKQGWAV